MCAPSNIADASPSNTAPVQSSATTAAPEPTNAANGTNTYCGKYYIVATGDYCTLVSSQNGIVLSDFYFLNPEIDANCTNLELGKAYCVAPVGTISTYSGYGGAVTTTGACATAFARSTCFGATETLTSVPFMAANATFSVTRASTTATETAVP
ncbi:Peptidoglycan-binding lysin domain [Lasiodiplodia theobromae]|nr:Peptidoglycan-binding lysin domain [Lasiodiplodia theobromae]